jgi:DNA invertase Pin-like site-specific DNA recombinase
MATSRRVALYVRVSTNDRGKTVENQLQPLQEAAGRLGWTVVAVFATKASVAPGGATGGLGWMRC